MKEKLYDDSNWREEYKGYTSNKRYIELLENGPKSLSQSWLMQAMYNKWKKRNGYKDPEPPDCQSSLKEFFSRQDSKEYSDELEDPFGGH